MYFYSFLDFRLIESTFLNVNCIQYLMFRILACDFLVGGTHVHGI